MAADHARKPEEVKEEREGNENIPTAAHLFMGGPGYFSPQKMDVSVGDDSSDSQAEFEMITDEIVQERQAGTPFSLKALLTEKLSGEKYDSDSPQIRQSSFSQDKEILSGIV